MFPCTHAFHKDCLLQEVSLHSKSTAYQSLFSLPPLSPQVSFLLGDDEKAELSMLARVVAEGGKGGMEREGETLTRDNWNEAKVSWSSSPGHTAHPLLCCQVRLDAMVGGECLYCGERMIDSVKLSFIPLASRKEAEDSWK